mgnify:CR=1 FL=1
MKYKILVILLIFAMLSICIYTYTSILVPIPEKAMNIIITNGPYWQPIIDANGGMDTIKDSIYDRMGLKVHLSISEPSYIYTSLAHNQIDGAGCNFSQYILLGNENITMPYIVSTSNGEYGIIANNNIKQIEDLKGKKIGVVRYSEGHILSQWLVSKSSINNKLIEFIYFDNIKDIATAVNTGKLDAGAVSEPYLKGNILFTTKDANNLILYGMVFKKDYINSNRDMIEKFVEGAIKAQDKKIVNNITLNDYNRNIELFEGIIETLHSDINSLWADINEKPIANVSFDGSIIKALKNKFPQNIKKETPINKDLKNLLQQSLTINFELNSSVINEDSFATLDKLINTAKILDNTIIQIEGNCSSDGNADANLKLSFERAQAVANYLIIKGIDKNRLIIIGNGETKPKGDNNTDEGKKINRRTDIFFKVAK